MEVKIYKITCNLTGLCYYGSTKKKLITRLSEHKNDYKRFLNGRLRFLTSFDIIKNNDYKIELIEECFIDNKKEREGYYIRKFDCVNKNKPDGTQRERDKKFSEKNKETIAEKKKEKGKVKYTCECGSILRKDGKSEHKKTKKHQKFLKN
jgi:hypothetical protein